MESECVNKVRGFVQKGGDDIYMFQPVIIFDEI